MANQFLNTDWVAMEVLRLQLNKLHIAQAFATKWGKEFEKEFAVGSTITVKKPQRWTITDGLGFAAQPVERQSTTISLDQVYHIGFEWDDYEAAVRLERSKAEIREQYLAPAAAKLANELDSRAALFAYRNTPNVFGALGTDPTTEAIYLNAERRLFEKSCPDGDKYMIISPGMMSAYRAGQAVQFNPGPEIARQYKTGLMGVHAGWEWYRSNNLYRHTAGTWAGAVTVTGAGQSGGTLAITGTAGDTIKRGDRFSILNVNFVNPNSLRVVGAAQVQHFVALADYTLTAGPDTISIFPSIVGPGSPYQNVDALPANGAALTLWPGTTSPNGKVGTVGLGLANKQGFGIVGAKYDRPPNTECSYASDPQTGISVRFTRWWDGDTAKTKYRFDQCIGFGVLYADEDAVAVVGA